MSSFCSKHYHKKCPTSDPHCLLGRGHHGWAAREWNPIHLTNPIIWKVDSLPLWIVYSTLQFNSTFSGQLPNDNGFICSITHQWWVPPDEQWITHRSLPQTRTPASEGSWVHVDGSHTFRKPKFFFFSSGKDRKPKLDDICFALPHNEFRGISTRSNYNYRQLNHSTTNLQASKQPLTTTILPKTDKTQNPSIERTENKKNSPQLSILHGRFHQFQN